jgi:ribonucleoside-diphosphate reductase beta chain
MQNEGWNRTKEEPVMRESWDLYRKAVRFGTWDPAEIDLSLDRAILAQLSPEQQETILRLCCGFHEGEESVAVELAPWITLIDGLEQKLFLTTQVFEEAKHTEFFIRYFAEVITPQFGEVQLNQWVGPRTHYILTESLQETGHQVQQACLTGTPAQRLETAVAAVTHYHAVIEGMLAMSAYHQLDAAFQMWGQALPGLQAGFREIRADEGRHVTFGMTFLRTTFSEHPELKAVSLETWNRLIPEDLSTMYLLEHSRRIAEQCRQDRFREMGLAG